MPARINRKHTEQILERIALANIVSRLQKNALGTLKNRLGESIEMSAGQIRTAELLLNKRLANAVAPVKVDHSFTFTQMVLAASGIELQDDGDDERQLTH